MSVCILERLTQTVSTLAGVTHSQSQISTRPQVPSLCEQASISAKDNSQETGFEPEKDCIGIGTAGRRSGILLRRAQSLVIVKTGQRTLPLHPKGTERHVVNKVAEAWTLSILSLVGSSDHL